MEDTDLGTDELVFFQWRMLRQTMSLRRHFSRSDIGVTFDDIGALESVKDTLKDLIMLPLQRPELFSESQLTKVYICNLYKSLEIFDLFVQGSITPALFLSICFSH